MNGRLLFEEEDGKRGDGKTVNDPELMEPHEIDMLIAFARRRQAVKTTLANTNWFYVPMQTEKEQ